MLRPAPVTSATRPLSSEFIQPDRLVEGAPGKSQEPAGLRFAPAAIGAIELELFLHVGARQRLVNAAAHMRLPLFEYLLVFQRDPDMTGEVVGIGILRVDLVADLCREVAQPRLLHALFGEGVQA